MKKTQSFEQAMKRLEEISHKLESGDIALDESIKLYEEGIKLIEFCQSKLNEAEKKIQKLSKDSAGNFDTEPLDSQDILDNQKEE
ncbi:MAG: exodeoxyribonuclease VII small subunit [Calditrichaeota bacterium]|nr:exodeoxyribonuclease VII small subunit [Calditrichota bacterium]RQW07455.1 MAG: exodeoxyribonuclease VII small subunit [Calditrichota bacterium]